MSTEDRYILWNYMLAEHCLLADSCEGTVLLTVAPRTLVAALEDAGEGECSPEDAEADFTAAVAAVYRDRVLRSPKKLRALKSTFSNDVPFGIGFLALSVLAAFHMRTDDVHTGRAFYPRLAEMLGCGLALTRSLPVGFEGDAFLELWDELATWLKTHHGRELAAPDAVGVRRYVAYPFAHVPLRQVDIERLPQFFDVYGYEPGARAPLDRLAYDLCEASGPWRYLTESGQSALNDRHRRPFVVRQVAHELEGWDGCRVDSSGARTATIELWMDIRRRRVHLHLLARRPTGFPDLIEDGELAFASSQDGWYEPVPLGRGDGPLLENGVRVGTRTNGGRYLLQLRQARVLPLTPSEHTGFVSDRVLRADTECAVLCAEPLVDEVARYLQALSRERVYPRRDDTIPSGWCLFTEVRATNECSPPLGLESLGVESSLALIPEGGLRLGRRWIWLESAPAKLTVLGDRRNLTARVDGHEVPLDEAGRVQTDLLAAAGQHVVEIGNRLRQRVTVLQGTVHPDCQPWLEASGDAAFPIAVPAGHWILLGTGPGESESVLAPPEGALVRPPFGTHWAVCVGSGTGAKALHIHDRGFVALAQKRSPQRASAKDRGARWTDTIYQAGVRRPDFLCQYGCAAERLGVEWRQLMEAARAIKRARRRRR